MQHSDVLRPEPPDSRAAWILTFKKKVEPSSRLRSDRDDEIRVRRDQAMYMPPLADSVEPVMKPASSAARNTTQRAISSGSPRRRTGIWGRIALSRTSFGTAFTISVAI